MIRKAARHAGLRQMLTERRRAMQDDLEGRVRDGRTGNREETQGKAQQHARRTSAPLFPDPISP